MAWSVETLNRRVGKELDSLRTDLRADYTRIAELIEEFGPDEVDMPHVGSLKGTRNPKLWEMRMKDQDGIARAIYLVASRKRVIVLHIFGKKSGKMPRRAIGLAKARAKGV